MALVPFKYHLHDDSESHEREEYIAVQTGLSYQEIVALDIGNPFYEITMDCMIDTETGEIHILDIEQRS